MLLKVENDSGWNFWEMFDKTVNEIKEIGINYSDSGLKTEIESSLLRFMRRLPSGDYSNLTNEYDNRRDLLVISFSFIHEFGHILAAIFTGNAVDGIYFGVTNENYPFLFSLYVSMVYYHPEPINLIIIGVSGSLTSLSVAFPLFLFSLKKSKLYLLSSTTLYLIGELSYWLFPLFGLNYGDASVTYGYSGLFKTPIPMAVGLICLIFIIVIMVFFTKKSSDLLTQKIMKKWEED